MNNEIDKNQEMWGDFIRAYKEYKTASITLNQVGFDDFELIKNSLNNPFEREAALLFVKVMPLSGKQELFADILEIACYANANTKFARDIILSMPHKWLIQNIEDYAKPILRRNDFEEYRGILTLYSKIDKDMTQNLARKAMTSDDLDMRETGEDFFKDN